MKKSKYVFIILGIVVVIGIVWSVAKSQTVKPTKTESKINSQVATTINNKDLVIDKSSVKSATFVPYEINGTKMEIVAVKATDGTIRTAFNTCQVCFSSGRGYYKVIGDKLVCQNCGNKFSFDQVEKEKGGCNPVPILSGDKTENNDQIIISKTYLATAQKLFASWKS